MQHQVDLHPFRKSESLSLTKPKRSIVQNPEETYWRNQLGLGKAAKVHFCSADLSIGHHVVQQLEFSQLSEIKDYRRSKNYQLSVCGGPRLLLYGTTLQSILHKQLAGSIQKELIDYDQQVRTQGQITLCVATRHDGRLTLIGTPSSIRLVDSASRATVSTIPTASAVRRMAWLRNGQDFVSVSDDGRVRAWTVGQNEPIHTSEKQGDTVIALDIFQKGDDCYIATGGHDCTVRLYSKTLEPLAVWDHGSPVKDLAWHPQQQAVISVGGNRLCVWDRASGKLITESKAFRKTVTSVVVLSKPSNDGLFTKRILTGSLDGLIRVFALEDSQLSILHGVRWPYAIAALAVTLGGDRLAIAGTDGRITVRQVKTVAPTRKRTRLPPAGTYAFFMRGQAVTNAEDSMGPTKRRTKSLGTHDLALKQFRYGDALDEALQSRSPKTVVAVLEELGRRRGLKIAIQNRDEESLEPLVSFCSRYISHPRYAAVLIGLANFLLDTYGGVIGQSEVIDEQFSKLRYTVEQECSVQLALWKIQGSD